MVTDLNSQIIVSRNESHVAILIVNCHFFSQCLNQLMMCNKVRGFAKVIVSKDINSGLSFL